MDVPYYRQYELPWTLSAEQERSFRKTLVAVLGVLLALGIVWPWLPAPGPDPLEAEEVPPRFAKLLLERTPPPPPPPKVVEQEPEPEPIEEPEPEKVVEKEPEPEPEIVPEPEIDRTEEARKTAARAGLMAFADDLADLRDADVTEQLDSNRPLTGAVGEGLRNERSLITSKAGASSGGINTAALSRNTGGSGLSGRATTRVEAPVVANAGSAGGVRRSGQSGKASRSQEEIELVFDRNKGAIYRIYNRALRQDPTLQGKLVLRLTIAPNGAVTSCEVVSSELDDPELERKLVQRVRMFRFQPKDVEPITTTKPIDFFPA